MSSPSDQNAAKSPSQPTAKGDDQAAVRISFLLGVVILAIYAQTARFDFKKLTWLQLGSTQVTEAGLKELKELKNLSWLYLGGTPVTDAGLKELKEALPKCAISPKSK
jgi:hypothetical protein